MLTRKEETLVIVGLVALVVAITLTALAGLAYGGEPRSTEAALRSLGYDSPSIPEAARAIDKATDKRWERAMLGSVLWHESRIKPKLLNCEEFGDQGQAHGGWQSHKLRCPATVEEQAAEAIRHLRSTANYCKGGSLASRVHGAVSLYATGRTCVWKGADKRVRTFRRLLPRL